MRSGRPLNRELTTFKTSVATKRFRRRSNRILLGVALAVIVAAILGYFLLGLKTGPSFDGAEILGKDSVFVTSGSGSGARTARNQYRVYLQDQGGNRHTIVVEDKFFGGGLRLNSADAYAALQVGECYNITTRGIRFGFFSAFPNLDDFESVPCPTLPSKR